MPMVLAHHGRQELTHRQEVRDRVDLEGLPDLRLGLVQYGAFVAYAGVVHQHRWVAVVCADLVCDGFDAVCVGDVAGVESDVFGCSISTSPISLVKITYVA